MAMSLEMFTVIQVETKDYPTSTQYKNVTIMTQEVILNGIKYKCSCANQAYRFQYPISSSEPGMSSSLELVIKSLK